MLMFVPLFPRSGVPPGGAGGGPQAGGAGGAGAVQPGGAGGPQGPQWPPCVDGFMARGPIQFRTPDASPNCQSFHTHGMVDQCGALGVDEARLLSCSIKDSVAITGEKGVYYVRDGIGKVTTNNMAGWVNCPVPKSLCPAPFNEWGPEDGSDVVGGPSPMHAPGDGLYGQFIPESDAVTMGGMGGEWALAGGMMLATSTAGGLLSAREGHHDRRGEEEEDRGGGGALATDAAAGGCWGGGSFAGSRSSFL